MTDVSRQTIQKGLKLTGKLLPQNVSIGGPGIIVEIDESKFGKRNTIEDIELMVYGC